MLLKSIIEIYYKNRMKQTLQTVQKCLLNLWVLYYDKPLFFEYLRKNV